MEFYLFPDLASDETIVKLSGLRENGRPCHSLYPALFDFACRLACTGETVREYVVRHMLRNPPACWRADVMLPYLMQDARTVYDLFFASDWDSLCDRAGMLPFPVVRSEKNCSAGESAYRETLELMVNAENHEVLCEHISRFFNKHRNEDEALYRAFDWDSVLTGVTEPDPISFDNLRGLEHQKNTVIANTKAFVEGLPANDILLVGGGGTGKSSCVKAALNRFAGNGLRLVEPSRGDLWQLPALLKHLSRQKLKYIVFLDDLSFENADENYLALKNVLDGQVAKRPANVLIYATSNRRRLVRETWKEREATEDIHENDTVSEKYSLSERFGIRLFFPHLTQNEYFDIVRTALEGQGMPFTEETAARAAAWAIENNGRSGRSAKQFIAAQLAGLHFTP